MALITDADIFAAIEAFLATLSPTIKTVITNDECLLTDADLPAVIVIMGDGTQQRTNASAWTEDNTVEIGAYFTRLCGDTLIEQRAQMIAALALRNVIPDAYGRLKRLAVGSDLLDHDRLGNMTKSHLETRAWIGEEVYYSTTYRFTLTTDRR